MSTISESTVIQYADEVQDTYGDDDDYYDKHFEEGVVHIVERLPYHRVNAKSLKLIYDILHRDYVLDTKPKAKLNMCCNLEPVVVESKTPNNTNVIQINFNKSRKTKSSCLFISLLVIGFAILLVVAAYQFDLISLTKGALTSSKA